MFKIIPSSNNLYEASADGEIRRVISEVNNQPKHKVPGVKRVGGTVLSPGTKSNGYLSVSLHINGKQVSRYVHRLVAEAWLGEIPPKMTVNHKDGNKSNNNLSNLEIMSQSDNNKHSFLTGLKKPTILKGEDNPRSVVTEKEVGEIRKMYAGGKRIMQLLIDFPHLNRDIISSVVNRRTWRHVY